MSLHSLCVDRKFEVHASSWPAADQQFEVCPCLMLHAGIVIPWMTGMDLPSLQLQCDCSMSVTEGVAGCVLFLAPVTLITRWPWHTNLIWRFWGCSRTFQKLTFLVKSVKSENVIKRLLWVKTLALQSHVVNTSIEYFWEIALVVALYF